MDAAALAEMIGLSILAGVFAGLFAGMLGLGGAMTIVPVMNYILPLSGMDPRVVMHAALVMSLAAMIFTTGAAALHRWRNGDLDAGLFGRLAPAVLVGAGAGVAVADVLDSHVLRVIFVFYVGFVLVREVLRLVRRRPGGAAATRAAAGAGGDAGLPRPLVTQPYFVLTGAAGAMNGGGAALLATPFLTGAGLSMHAAAGQAAGLSAVIAVVGTIAYILAGLDEPGMPPLSLGYIYLPALLGMVIGAAVGSPAGVRLSHLFRQERLRLLFVAMVAVSFTSMVLKLAGLA